MSRAWDSHHLFFSDSSVGGNFLATQAVLPGPAHVQSMWVWLPGGSGMYKAFGQHPLGACQTRINRLHHFQDGVKWDSFLLTFCICAWFLEEPIFVSCWASCMAVNADFVGTGMTEHLYPCALVQGNTLEGWQRFVSIE
jgi:hypothetical protein